MNRKPKLLIVGAFPPQDSQIYGGIVTTCNSLLNPEFSEQFELLLIDSTQRSNPPPNFFVRSIFALVRFTKYLYRLVAASPDAVLLFAATGASLFEKSVMARIARSRRIPAFLFPRGAEIIDIASKSAFQRAWIKPAMRCASYFLCQGPSWQRFAVNDLGFPVEKAPVIHNWAASADLIKLGADRESVRNSKIITFIFIGWLEKEKGVFELLEASRRLLQKHEFSLAIAGRGNAESVARDFVRSHSLERNVRFVGWVQDDKKNDLLRYADVLVLPSWAEGFPNVIIEAMAAKLAVVVSAVGNIPDLLTNRQQALLIPSRNVDALVRALEELLVSDTFRLEMAERGHEYAKHTFSTTVGISRLAAVIKDAVQSSRNTGRGAA